jgi:hemerythrin-like metal-binding protein
MTSQGDRMHALQWDDSMSIGVEEIDCQHKQLLEMVAETMRSLETGSQKEEVGLPLRRLCDYVIHHFATEEARMAPETYPQYDLHIQEHIDCSMAALDFLADFSSGKQVNIKDFLIFAQDWIKRHVLGTDQTLGEHLRSRA